MATIQRGTTKIANKLLSYAEKRAQERSGVDCPPEYAKSQFTATRELWGKTGGIQAHHIIQSFKPWEVTPELANQIGQDLAREITKGYEAVIYTKIRAGNGCIRCSSVSRYKVSIFSFGHFSPLKKR